MKKDFINEKEIPETELLVIADECGDSMWDAVLQQKVKACNVKAVPKHFSSLLNNIEVASRTPSGGDTRHA